ncbi:MAG TPA: nucleotidyltransferase [Streptosporangiaceae bacterium]
MRARGVDEDGYFIREGSLHRVQPEFASVVEAARAGISAAFGAELHSAYLCGSIPRGAAVPGVSDLDLLLVLRDEPGPSARAAARALEADLDLRFPQVDGVGAGLSSVATILSEQERYDLGWFVACLCTPLAGGDLADRLPRYRPTSLLARETNGDIGDRVAAWQHRLAGARDDAALRLLSRHASRRLVRTGLTLVMPRWGGWTSDLTESAAVFGRYYPERLSQMAEAALIARAPTADRAVLGRLIDDLGPWLAGEYRTEHGRKAVRV